ncbi:unnamed protein product [Didymodactylos carnosus]|uniref:Uncharacterized protein n=1 Tax=Didymodactylos carnosus TaxID=1234261 RepID=A0A8S2VVM6_9BILA|nr:unnamed protein product [Didymodactylos carnosus]CAF4410791.1 unnamed protein product [Didymodactylos carnosus]
MVFIDGQDLIVRCRNGRFERLTDFISSSTNLHDSVCSINYSNDELLKQIGHLLKKLACLVTTIADLQTNFTLLERSLNKIQDFFKKLNVNTCLQLKSVTTNSKENYDNIMYHYVEFQLSMTDRQSKLQPNDLMLLLICRLSNTHVHLCQTMVTSFSSIKCSIPTVTCLCQPILMLKPSIVYGHKFMDKITLCQILKPILLFPNEKITQTSSLMTNISTLSFSTKIEKYFQRHFNNKFKYSNENQIITKHKIELIMKNESAINFKSKI